MFRAFLKVFKTLFSYLLSENTKNIALGLRRNVSPHLYSAAIELNSSLFAGSSEIVKTSFHGSKRVVPSVLSAIRTVAPHTLHAMSELILSSRDSAIVVYPTLLKAAVAVHPDVRRSMAVVLQDGSTVLVEVATASYTASCHLVLVVREVSNRLPLVLKAIQVVTASSIDASTEVLSTSSRARSRLTSDLRAAGFKVTSSMEGLEGELRSTLEQVALEIDSIVSDNPEVGYFYRALFIKEDDGQAASLLNDKINYLCYLSFLITSSSIGLARRFYCVFVKFFSKNSDDEENRFSFFYAAFCKVVDSFDFGGYLHLTYENLMGLLSSVTYCVVSCIRSQMSIVSYSEFCERVLPDLWQHFKRSVSMLWKSQCEVADELWTFLEKMSEKIWELTQRYAPDAWSTFKEMCLKTWLLACQVSPGLWDFLSSTTIPLMWNYNRRVVRTLWKAYLRTCSDTWKVVAPLTSTTWECTLSATPKVWVAVSENSKHRWQVFCDSTEQGYESATGVGASAWDALNKIISNSWSYAVRPATLTACCTTSSIVAKSIKLSHITYTKTGKFLLLCIELPGSKFQSMKVEILSSKKASATRDILKRCVTFSNENLLAPGSKRKLAYKALKEVTDCFKMDNIFNNLVKMYKIPLIPVTRSCAFGQEMYKKYSSPDCFQESFIFPSYGSDGF